MAFDLILKRLCEGVGAVGAIMLDWEGESVALYSKQESLDLVLIGAQFCAMLNSAKEASLNSGASNLKSLALSTDAHAVILLSLKEGYYALVVVPKSLPVAKALRDLRPYLNEIEAEMG